MWALLVLYCFVAVGATGEYSAVLNLRGGLVPQAGENGEDYYEQFTLDYGCEDNVRIAGSMRGLIKSGRLAALPESDPFLKWLNDKLEKGAEAPSGRVKPYYAADFGSKADLKRGENPKIIIVNLVLAADKQGLLTTPSKDVDVEVRTVWQPWLKARCDFVVRYIVPNRTNIIELMEAKGRFRSELQVDRKKSKKDKEAVARMIFKPTLMGRLRGRRDVVINRKLDASKLVN